MRRTSLKRHAPVLGAQEVLMAVRLRQPRAQPARDRHGHRVAHQRPPLRLPRTAAPHSGRAAHAYPAPQLGAGLCRHQAERLRARAARAGPGTAHSRRRLVAGRGHAGPGAAACKHECGPGAQAHNTHSLPPVGSRLSARLRAARRPARRRALRGAGQSARGGQQGPHLPALGVGVLEAHAVAGRAVRAHRPARPRVALRQALQAWAPRQRPPPRCGSLAGDAPPAVPGASRTAREVPSDMRLAVRADCSAVSAHSLS